MAVAIDARYKASRHLSNLITLSIHEIILPNTCALYLIIPIYPYTNQHVTDTYNMNTYDQLYIRYMNEIQSNAYDLISDRQLHSEGKFPTLYGR